jgi:hypothetical protein
VKPWSDVRREEQRGKDKLWRTAIIVSQNPIRAKEETALQLMHAKSKAFGYID